MVGQLVLVRHAQPIIDPSVPSEKWTLSEEGLEAAHKLGLFLQVDCGTRIWSSDEIKAQQTADRIARVIGTDVGTDDRLAEVGRPFVGEEATYRKKAISYLKGEDPPGWEPRSEVLQRFSEAIDELLGSHDGETLVVVNHGLAMTLYVESAAAISRAFGGEVDPVRFWSGLSLPDAWRLDIARRWLDRIGFTWDGLPISNEPPHGAAALVYRRGHDHIEFLLLHRSGAPKVGDWAWTPPAGARFPGEDLMECAKRELMEETGLDLRLVESEFGSVNWPHFLAEAHEECVIRLSDEHDQWEWVEASEACDRCLPSVVSDAMRRAMDYLKANG